MVLLFNEKWVFANLPIYFIYELFWGIVWCFTIFIFTFEKSGTIFIVETVATTNHWTNFARSLYWPRHFFHLNKKINVLIRNMVFPECPLKIIYFETEQFGTYLITVTCEFIHCFHNSGCSLSLILVFVRIFITSLRRFLKRTNKAYIIWLWNKTN